MAKQNLNIGAVANDSTGDSLRDGAIKLNGVIDELYTNLGNNTNLLININSPSQGQVLRWTGSIFEESHLDALSANLNVKTFKIISESNGNIDLKPNGTGDIRLHAGAQGSAYVYVDGADGYLKYKGDYANAASLPAASEHHGMFAHAHEEGKGYFAHSGVWTQLIDVNSSINELSDVNTTTGGGPSNGQVLKWDATAQYWYPANDSVGGGDGGGLQNSWQSIFADSGQTTTSAVEDILTIAGGTAISTSITGDTLTINFDGVQGSPDQNLFATIAADTGSMTANSVAATVNIKGALGGSISTSVNGSDLIITNSSPNIVQECYPTVTGNSGATTAQLSTSSLSIVGTAGNGITTSVTQNTVSISAQFYTSDTISENKSITFGSAGESVIVASPTLGWTITGSTGQGYLFTGPGVSSSASNPTIYVYRGFTYRFNNTAGSAHPFRLRTSSGGSNVSDGLTGSVNGVQYWTVPMTLTAGTTYVYQCTLHAQMVGNLVVV